MSTATWTTTAPRVAAWEAMCEYGLEQVVGAVSSGRGGPRMKSGTPAISDGSFPEAPDFSFVLGGPLFQLLRRAHLSDDGLLLVRQRIIVISLIAWLPLLFLSALDREALRRSVAVPFLLDAEVQVRFLVAMPLLIGAELLVHRRMLLVAKQFLQRNLIPGNAMARFDSAIASAAWDFSPRRSTPSFPSP